MDQPSSGPVLSWQFLSWQLLSWQASEFRGGERGQLLGQAAGLGRAAVGRLG
jgi:hypothetical protein